MTRKTDDDRLKRQEMAIRVAAKALATTVHGPRMQWTDRDCWKPFLDTARMVIRAHKSIVESIPTCWKCEIEQGIGYCRCEIAAND